MPVQHRARLRWRVGWGHTAHAQDSPQSMSSTGAGCCAIPSSSPTSSCTPPHLLTHKSVSGAPSAPDACGAPPLLPSRRRRRRGRGAAHTSRASTAAAAVALVEAVETTKILLRRWNRRQPSCGTSCGRRRRRRATGGAKAWHGAGAGAGARGRLVLSPFALSREPCLWARGKREHVGRESRAAMDFERGTGERGGREIGTGHPSPPGAELRPNMVRLYRGLCLAPPTPLPPGPTPLRPTSAATATRMGRVGGEGEARARDGTTPVRTRFGRGFRRRRSDSTARA